MKYSKKMLAVLETRVQFYEQTIEDLETGEDLYTVIERIRDKFLRRSCPFCVGVRECRTCIIDRGLNSDCLGKTRSRIWHAIDNEDLKGLIRALKARLKWMLDRVEKNGYVLE
jgi:hypothetical protein